MEPHGSLHEAHAWIHQCMREYEKPLVAYATKLLGDPERARDVVQETFISLCRQPREKVSLKTKEWLFTVCRNRAMDILRKESRMTHLDPTEIDDRPGDDKSPQSQIVERESGTKLLSLLDTLAPNQREVIRLKFLHDMSYKEISAVTKLSVTNVGFLIHTGLKTLRSRLADQPELS